MLATAGALVVGKAVLIANTMPFLRRYDRAPLIQPILFKTLVYWAIVFLARLLEAFVHFRLIEHSPVSGFLPHMVAIFSWHRFAAIQIWILVLFLIYVTASELNHLFGEGQLLRILFTHRPSELQLNRRQRIRELIRLSDLADAHSVTPGSMLIRTPEQRRSAVRKVPRSKAAGAFLASCGGRTTSRLACNTAR